MAELRVRKREPQGDWWYIWPDTCDIPQGVIEENEEYEFELVDVESPDETTLYIDGTRLEALRSPDDKTARWAWSPGYYSGLVRIDIGFKTGKHARAEIEIDPRVAKLTRGRYNQMVEDILEDTTVLFSIGPYRTGIGQGPHHELPPIARLEYLHSRLNRIVEIVREIDENPVRILKTREQVVSHHEARKVTGKELVKSLRSGTILEETQEPDLLPESLDGIYPATIRKQSVETGLDIQEHREIKAALVTWKDWLLTVSNRLDATADESELGRQKTRWASRSRRMSERLGRLLGLSLFESVADISDTPTISSIYRQKPHYREFFHLCQEMEQGLSNVTGDALEIPISRTYELYELWCFLRIARALAEDARIEDPDVSDLFEDTGPDGLVLAASSVTLDYGDDFTLAYQKGFGEYWREEDLIGSISRRMRPDIAIIAQDRPQETLIMDAKYRVETALNEALSSAHTYRDAIVKEEEEGGNVVKMVSGSFLMSPYEPETVTDWRTASLPDRLFDEGYRSEFSIGAAPLRPGMELGEIRERVKKLCNDANVSFLSDG